MSLQNASIVITGGSGGLGRALGRQLAAAGAKVVLVARGSAGLEEAVAQIRRAGGQAWGIPADLGDARAIYPLAHQAAELAGPVDVLVNAASTLGPTPLRLLLDTECEDLQRVLDVNLLGPFRLTKVLAGSMALRGRGLVVNISSDAAVEAYPTWGGYGLSKAALDHLTRTLAAELTDTGVRFISVDPGEMDTQMHRDAIPDADPSTLADPAEVAATVVSMIADETTAASGQRIVASSWEAHR